MGFQLDNIKAKKIKKENTSFDIDALLKKEIILFGKQFSNKKKEAFYTDLNVLLDAGVQQYDALVLLANEQKKEVDKTLILNIAETISSGSSFSEAIKSHKDFSEYEYYSIKIAEETGALTKVSKELSSYFLRKNEQRREIINALSYPMIIISTAFLVILFMLQFVVPMFAEIFKQNNVELPTITKFILTTSDFISINYGWFLLFLFIFVTFIKVNKKKLWYRKWSSKWFLKLPFLGEFDRKVKMAQFTQAISLLVSSDIKLLDSVVLTRKMINYYPLEQALKNVEVNVKKGESFYNSIAKESIFDKRMLTLIKVAEETNRNETIFERLTQNYNTEITQASQQFKTFLGPFITLILGFVVGFILIAMYLPMIQLSTIIG